MEQPADDVAPGSVLMVMQPGYELFGRNVRPAMVIVSPKAAAQTTAPDPANPYTQTGETSGGAEVDTKA